MRCQTCGYSLANLRSRTCPECGNGFKPSDFEFAPGTVAFCCPHCEQDYYGTTIEGHLYPNAFNCAKCNQFVHMDDMLMRPAEGLEATDTEVHNVPWAQRDEIGSFKAFRQTVAMAIGHPSEFGHGRPQESETSDALKFAAYSLLAVALGWVISQTLFQVIMFGCIVPTIPAGPGGAPATNPFGVTYYIGMFGGQLLGALIAVPFGLLVLWIWALCSHGILKLTGNVEMPAYASKRAFFYATGANLLSLIPCLGFLIGGPWAMVSTIIALKSSQKVGAGRAILAVLPLPILGIATSVGFMVWSFTTAMATMGGAAPFGTFNPSTEALTQTYVSWANLNSRYPKHVVELVMDNSISIDLTIQTNSLTMYDDLILGTFDSNATDDMAESARRQAFQAYLASLPPNILAYRYGDFVFYPSPKPPNQTDPTRWLIVAWPAPVSNGPLGPNELVEVGLADGTTIYHINSAFPQMLAAENNARALANLPPIPHPSTVTHASVVLTPANTNGSSNED